MPIIMMGKCQNAAEEIKEIDVKVVKNSSSVFKDYAKRQSPNTLTTIES